jgi:hypothetical protein
MNEIRDRLDQQASGFDPGAHAYERVLGKADRRRLIRRFSATVTATVITGLAFAGLWSASHHSIHPPGRSPSAPQPSGGSEPPSSMQPILPRGGLEIARTTDANGWVVLPDPFGVWVAGSGTLTRIDPDTGAARVTAHGSWDYDFVRLAEYGGGTIFIASGTTLLTMDAGSGTVISKLDLSSLGYVDAVLESNGTWVTASGGDGSQVLAKIDPDTGKVLQRVDGIGQGLHELAQAGGHLFVGSREYSGSPLLRFDPLSGQVTRVRTAPAGASLAGVGSHLWMTGTLTFGGIHCLDADTLQSCGDVDIPGYIRLAASGGDLWVLSVPPPGSSAGQRANVTVIDGANGDVLAGPLSIPGGHPSSIAAFQRRAWVGYYHSGTVIEVVRCDPQTCPAP